MCHVGVLNTAKRKVLTTNMHSMVKTPEGLTIYVQEYQKLKRKHAEFMDIENDMQEQVVQTSYMELV